MLDDDLAQVRRIMHASKSAGAINRFAVWPAHLGLPMLQERWKSTEDLQSWSGIKIIHAPPGYEQAGTTINVQLYDVDMSTAAESPHEFVVDASLADELERRGVHVHAGDRVRLQLVPKDEPKDEQTVAWEAFVGSFTTGEPDFAERSEEILRAEFGR